MDKYDMVLSWYCRSSVLPNVQPPRMNVLAEPVVVQDGATLRGQT